MHVISRKRLREFGELHPDSVASLDVWYRTARSAAWQSIVDVKRSFSSADAVGPFTVFNIGGNKYRLIVDINYKRKIVYVRDVMTHAGYDKERWKS